MSDVYFLPVTVKRIDSSHSLLARYEKMLSKLITPEMVKDRQVAIKFHLGGRYGYTHVNAAFVTRVVERVKECGGRPFITDHRVDNRRAGFIPEAFGCPIYHATGLHDRYMYKVKTGSRLLPEVEIAGYLRDADVLINLSHAKAHGMCAFGAAIKNLGMGAVTGKSRGDIHGIMDNEYKWLAERCTHCKKCVSACEHKAIEFNDEGKLEQNTHHCTLCMHCMTVCPKHAIVVSEKGWPKFQKGLAIATKAVLDTFEPGRQLHINVALSITAICDCWGMSLAPFMPDVGVFASTDPVAVDKATIDHMDYDDAFPGTLPEEVAIAAGPGHILQRMWNKDPYAQVVACEQLGIGSSKYNLKKMV
jgi:hypothetical protein